MLARLSSCLCALTSPNIATVRLLTRMESFSSVQLTDEVLTDRRGPLMLVTLNRPKALNSLNGSMVEQLNHYFRESDTEGNDISAIVVQGAGGKAFCAGGDVKATALAETPEERIDFFRKEYRMNHTIAKMQKPTICLMDGIIMGGGCGVAMHTPFRVATERTVCAMPECVIGFIPDVGSSYFLNRLPDTIGAYMAVTGKRIKGLELKAVGLATHYISSQKMSDIIDRLQEIGPAVRDHSVVDSELKQFEDPFHLKEMPGLQEKLSKMGRLFNPFHTSVDQIREQLQTAEDDMCKEALENMNGGAPLSLELAHELLKRTAGQSLRSCLETEFIVATHLCRNEGDFYEGVRALLIDKDKNPKWKFSAEQVIPEIVAGFFQAEDGHISLFTPTAKL